MPVLLFTGLIHLGDVYDLEIKIVFKFGRGAFTDMNGERIEMCSVDVYKPFMHLLFPPSTSQVYVSPYRPPMFLLSASVSVCPRPLIYPLPSAAATWEIKRILSRQSNPREKAHVRNSEKRACLLCPVWDQRARGLAVTQSFSCFFKETVD